MLDVIACQSCAGPTTFITEIAPLGSAPGHRVHFCESCRRYTWSTWHVAQQQQQQQRQPQKKPKPDETR